MDLERLIALFIVCLSSFFWYYLCHFLLRIELPTLEKVSNTKCISVYYAFGIARLKIDSLRVHLYCQNGSTEETIETTCVIRDGSFKIFFPAKVAGLYNLSLEHRYLKIITVNFTLTHLEPCHSSIYFEEHGKLAVMDRENICLRVVMRDIYGNLVHPTSAEIHNLGIESHLNFKKVEMAHYIDLIGFAREAGSSLVKITYNGLPIKTSQARIIYASKSLLKKIQVFSKGKGLQIPCIGDYVEGTLIQREGKTMNKTVYLYIRSYGLIVKEYIFGIIPKTIYIFPISHKYTRLGFDSIQSSIIRITDVFNKKDFDFVVSDVYFLVGIFLQVANLKSPTNFESKSVNFFSDFETLAELSFVLKPSIRVDRHCLLYSSITQLQNVRWNVPLKIIFNGELGIDDGGLRKEWYTLIWKELSESKVFILNERGSYGPNPVWQDMSIFEFAGKLLGKALSLGSNPKFRLHIPFSLSSSFLSLLKGMVVGYRHFEVDYPEFYKRQIKYIAENEVDDLELTFVDEVYREDAEGERSILLDTPELKPSGKKLKVTESNKFEYLNLLAKFRLHTQIQGPMSKFKKGFHIYVSEESLLDFDESELDLLFSGASKIDFKDLKRHHISQGVSSRVNEWFWLVLQNLSEDQKKLFLKFITGSSRLPPNGFKGLSPTFTIREIREYGKLPSSHVCANVLNLHPHRSFEAFETSFLTAITEGHAGFQNY